jgi:hypothetical protein
MSKDQLRNRLRNHPIVQRLLANPSWAVPAQRAMDFYLDNKPCDIPTWVKSSTWKQVKMAYDEISGQPE